MCRFGRIVSSNIWTLHLVLDFKILMQHLFLQIELCSVCWTSKSCIILVRQLVHYHCLLYEVIRKLLTVISIESEKRVHWNSQRTSCKNNAPLYLLHLFVYDLPLIFLLNLFFGRTAKFKPDFHTAFYRAILLPMLV